MSISHRTGALLEVVGAGLQVPLATGEVVRQVNLDHAASTQPLRSVVAALEEVLPWYSSVHRGSGWASQVSTMAYEAARESVLRFAGAREDDVAVFVRNATDGINLLAHALCLEAGDAILTTDVEHHANLLPWRRAGRVVSLAPPKSPAALLEAVDDALRRDPGIRVVAMTGASNVSGEVFPIAALAGVVHRHAAVLFIDAAQLLPHRPVDIAGSDVDMVAFSGHKMYAPFGAGAVISRPELLRAPEPMLVGGGAVTLVTPTTVIYKEAPEGLEAGTPNLVGALMMAAAMDALRGVGMDRVAAHESALLDRLLTATAGIPGLVRYRLWDDPADRVAVFPFNLEGMHHSLVAAALSAEHGIAVRNGCFCAQPYLAHLLGIPAAELEARAAAGGTTRQMAGAVRASIGVDTSEDDVDRFAAALRSLAAAGPRLEYRHDPLTGDVNPVGDLRTAPRFGWLPELTARGGPGCESI